MTEAILTQPKAQAPMRKNRRRLQPLALVFAACLACAPARGDGEPWEVKVTPYAWAVDISGEVGVRDIRTDFDVPLSRVLETLDLGGMLSVEARRNRWSLLADGVYMKLSDDLETPGPFFNTIDTTVENGTLDLALAYRVLEGKRGWVDLIVGARYVYVACELEMNPDYGAVDAISRALVDQAVTAVRDEFEDEVKRKAGGLSEDLAGLAGEVGSAARDKIRNALQLCVDGSADQVRQRVDEIMEKIDNIPPRKLEDLKNLIQEKLDGITDAQRNAFADAVKARLDDRGDEITGNAAAIKQEIRLAAEESIRELKVNASGKVRNALTKAERQLAAAIEAGMDKAAAADVEEEWDWVDPYVGVRGRINLPKRMFVGGRADVGFGVGSDLMVQLFGGVGVRLTRNVDLEAGWRYLSVDYDKDGFLWDTEYSGVGIGVAIAL
jgi:hypothetical protein